MGIGDETRSSGRRGPLSGLTASCVLLTVLVVLLAIFVDHPRVDPVLRPLYFALLFSFFHAIGRRQPELAQLPFRLIQGGFAVLTLGFTAGAVVRGLELSTAFALALTNVLERGAVFLLGLSLISYGILLWVPSILESRRVLSRRYAATRGALRVSEHERSRMEERFVDADRLHALGELAAGVAHDMRNPLAIIRAAATSMTARERDAAELAEHTSVIVRNVDKAERTIAALLELGKPRCFEMGVLALDPLIAEVTALVSVESRRRDIAIERRGASDLTVRGDRKLLSQVLLNLILNALQASPDGRSIVIRTRRAGDRVAVAVEDRGHGIAITDRDKLFTPFFTTKPDGTGLGLLSCRRLLSELSGDIALFPRSRGGARALVTLESCPQEVATP